MDITTIRPETYQSLGLSRNPTFLRHLEDAIWIFRGYSFRKATNELSTILYEEDKYTRDKSLNKLHFTTHSVKSFRYDFYFLAEEEVSIVAEELLFQYTARHPDFMNVTAYPGCEKELDAIKTKLGDSSLLLFKAVESIWYNHKDERLVQSCTDLLTSEKEASQKKGLEKLGFKSRYQELLLSCAKEIGELLQAMHNTYAEKQLTIAAQEELNDLPYEDSWIPSAEETVVEPSPEEYFEEENSTEESFPDEQSAEECTQPQPSYIKEYTIPDELAKLLANKASVLAIMAAHDALEEATANLLQAEKDSNDAALHYRQTLYDTAYSRFVKACEKYKL